MSSEEPLWRKGFNTVERMIGLPLERVVQTNQFAVALAHLTALQSSLSRRLARLQQRALHLGNVPAWTDVAQLVSQVARLERGIVALSEQIEREFARQDRNREP